VISVVDSRQRGKVFRDNRVAKLNDGSSRSKSHTLLIDSRLADATFGNWFDWIRNRGSKKGDVVFGR